MKRYLSRISLSLALLGLVGLNTLTALAVPPQEFLIISGDPKQ